MSRDLIRQTVADVLSALLTSIADNSAFQVCIAHLVFRIVYKLL
jgi:hypothetical protein